MRLVRGFLWTLFLLVLVSLPVYSQEFRVAIKTNDFASLTHESVVLSSRNGSLTLVDYQHNMVSNLPIYLEPTTNGIKVSDGEQDLMMDFPIWVYPEHQGTITIESIQRGDAWGFSPAYRGFLEIDLVDQQLQVINTVTVEQYLYGVVPSEMVSSWPLEALKAQAIASRTYVVRSIIQARKLGQNYHVDDSVFAQVYNNRQEDLQTSVAVDQTKGMVMLDQISNQLINAYFHSTSSGMTASSCDVWGGSARSSFPGTEVSYLTARSVTIGEFVLDITDDQAITDFLTSSDIGGYEQDSPWFRWSINFSREQLEQIISANLGARYHAAPEFVLTKQEDGSFLPAPIQEPSIGQLLDINVIQRGAGGNLITLELHGTKGTYWISKELNIRSLFVPPKDLGIVIERQDDTIPYRSILPSAFITFDLIKNDQEQLTDVVIYGGGNGHGVGMSQWGAKGMAEAGYDYLEILAAFYLGIDIINIYDFEHWDGLI